MSAIEIIVIVACVLIVGGVGIYALIRKKQGKCSCGCGDCAYSGSCHQKKKQKQTKK